MQGTKLFLGSRGLMEKWLSTVHFYLQKENRTLGKISDKTHHDDDLLSSDALSPLTDVFL